jgi:outer membrane protein assembly factor BamB
MVCCRIPLCFTVLLGAAQAADWPTLQHDMQRTGYTAVCPEPPYKIRWLWANGERLYPGKVELPRGKFTWEALPDFITARFMSLAQPMARNGVAFIGSAARGESSEFAGSGQTRTDRRPVGIEGELFAIDVKTGETKWQAPASGPILHSVTVGEEAVFVATLRGLDAFGLDGRKLWSFADPHRGGFWACPAVARGLVLIGGLTGYFYGVDAKTGNPRWEFRAYPAIYHCPAVHGSSVFFGAEDMHAYCLDIETGRLKWKSERLHGVTFGHYWPVVAAKAGVVMFRTSGLKHGHHSGMNAVKDAPADYRGAQEALRKHLQEHPYARSFFVLDLADGTERAMVACGYFGSQSDIPPPPIVRADGSALTWHYSKMGAFQPGGRFAHYASPVDFGEIDFETGFFKRLGDAGTLKYPTIVRFDDFHSNTMGGKYLFGMQAGLHWGCIPLDGKGPAASETFHNHLNRFRQSGKRGSVGYLGRNEHGAVAPTILEDVILVNPMNGVCLIAYESAEGK